MLFWIYHCDKLYSLIVYLAPYVCKVPNCKMTALFPIYRQIIKAALQHPATTVPLDIDNHVHLSQGLPSPFGLWSLFMQAW